MAGRTWRLRPVNPAELLNIQWQFNVAAGTAGGCTGTVTIDNITLHLSRPTRNRSPANREMRPGLLLF